MLLPFLRPHHVLRPRDRCRTIASLLFFGIFPEPMHAALSDAEISTIPHFARVPGKELPQEAPSGPVPICPPPTLADLHDAHPHPGFTMWQHSAHVEKPPVLHNAPGSLGAASSAIAANQYNLFLYFLRGAVLAAIDATIFGPGPPLGRSQGLAWRPGLLQRPPDRGLAAIVLAGQAGHGLPGRVAFGDLTALASV